LKSDLGDVAEVVQDIATKLSESAPQGWHGLVEYHRWMAYGELALTFIHLALYIFLIVFAWKQMMAARKHGNENLSYRGEWPGFDIFRAIASVVVIVGSSITIFNYIDNLPYKLGDAVVPERAAAIEVISIIKSGGEIPKK